jgi:hypothetical protein
MTGWPCSAFGASGRVVAWAPLFWLLSGACVLAQPAERGPLDKIADIGPAIRACWRPPEDGSGMELTLVFSLDRGGAVQGKPRISYSKLRGDPDQQRRFVASVLAALAACTPLEITASLGGAIAGRPFAMRFKAGASRPHFERRASTINLIESIRVQATSAG